MDYEDILPFSLADVERLETNPVWKFVITSLNNIKSNLVEEYDTAHTTEELKYLQGQVIAVKNMLGLCSIYKEQLAESADEALADLEETKEGENDE